MVALRSDDIYGEFNNSLFLIDLKLFSNINKNNKNLTYKNYYAMTSYFSTKALRHR